MPPTIYGTKNCDTIKTARTWLADHGQAYRFHDYRADGLDAATLARWIDVVGWEKLLNKAGTTFRALADADKTELDRDKAAALMLARPTLIKRPVLDIDGRLTVGFKPEIYAEVTAR